MTTIHLPWGKETLDLNLPEGWQVDGIMEPAATQAVSDTSTEVRKALSAPVQSTRLMERVQAGMRIVLVVDDGSRPTPVPQILPMVIEELLAGGARLEDITLVAALGVHRAMEESELQLRIGAEYGNRLKIVTHDCDDLDKLAFLGTSSRGVPVYINKNVAEADLVVLIGCIEPHIIASFGGGYKNLFPGVAGRLTIAKNHALNCQPDTFNMVGQPIEKNPMRQDLEEAGKMLMPPVFVINAVLNSALQVVKVVAGDPIAAHRAGAATSAEIYGTKVPAHADVVITTSNPMDQDLRQGVKALANTIRALRRGGTMLTTIRAEEGVGVFGLANRKLPLSKKMLKFLAPVIIPLVPKMKLKGMGEEDRFFLYFALQAMLHGKLLVYAPNIPEEIHERLPFVDFVSTPEEGLEIARKRSPKNAHVLVFPHGGSTYPILPD